MKLIKILKRSKLDACSFSISLFLLTIFLIIVKNFFIYQSFKYLFPLRHCLEYLVSDFYFLITIAFFVTVNLNVKVKIVRWINNILILFFILLFYIDIFTIHYFQTHETIISIISVAKYGGGGFSGIVIGGIIVLFILWSMVIYLYYRRLNNKIIKFFTPIIFTICFIGSIIVYLLESLVFDVLISDTKNILSINIKGLKEQMEDADILFSNVNYEDYMVNETGEGKDLNVILVFGESLSAIDSANVGGNDNMSNFDKIQKDGITFTNFISQGTQSIGAHISLFQGIPPLKIDNYNQNLECLPNFLNNLGYTTVHISTAKLTFLDERTQLQNCGFKKIIGDEEFEDKPHYTREAAPDEYLYDKALKEVLSQTGKYFISIPTISFHTPYNCPYGNTQELCLKYTDEKLYEFYKSLQKMGFFESGILIIVGDHRKREPAKRGEFNLYGPIWEYKSVATIVGSGIEAGSVNNNITQHTDFYYSIKKLLGHGDISVDKFYNDTFLSLTNRDWGIVDGYYTTYDGDKYDKLNMTTAKQKNPDIYDYYLSIKKLWLKDSLGANNLHKDI